MKTPQWVTLWTRRASDNRQHVTIGHDGETWVLKSTTLDEQGRRVTNFIVLPKEVAEQMVRELKP